MPDMNEIIRENIIREMKRAGKKQVELAGDIGVSRQTMSKMLGGERSVSASEIARIAEALDVSVDTLVKLRAVKTGTNPLRVFMGKVETPEAEEALGFADILSDLICFHASSRENGEALNVSWRT